MSGNTVHRGLCATCKHASTCTFPRDFQKPAFYCEEFEIETVPVRKRAGEDNRQSTAYFAVPQESPRLIGLCSDCQGRQTCVFPRPEGGVWHCEEYQ